MVDDKHSNAGNTTNRCADLRAYVEQVRLYGDPSRVRLYTEAPCVYREQRVR
jgi:hypothetical protein